MIQFAQTVNAFGQWLVSHLWRMSIELAILAGIVLAAIALLRIRSPRLRHLFLMLLLAKPVVTFLVASPLSLYGFLHPKPAPPPPRAPTVVVERVARDIGRPPMRPRWRPPVAIPRTDTAAPSAWRSIDRYGLAAIVWVTVAGALGLRLIVGWAYVVFLRATSQVQRSGPLVAATGEAARALKVRRRVTVALTHAAHGPVLAGVFRPMILLPTTLAEALSPEQIQLILAHELAHVRRWDNLVLVIQRLAEMVLFFHPVVWLAGWAMRREAEAACDDRVIGAYGESAAYADSLTRVAETRAGLTRRLLVNTFAAAESNLARRVRRILRGRAARTTLALSIASIVALVVIGCLGLPTASEAKPKPRNANRGDAMTDQRAKPQSTVKREGGKVWIEGVPSFDNADSGLSHLRAVRCVLEQDGENVDWDWLMGVSGEAFCYYYHPDGTFLSQFVHSWDVGRAALASYGHTGTWRFEPSDDTAPALAAIESEISQGRPVIAPGIMPAPDKLHSRCQHWFVVTGIDVVSGKVQVLGAGEKPLETVLPVGADPGPGRHPRWFGIARTFDGIDGHYGPKNADNPVLLVAKADTLVDRKKSALGGLTRAVALAREGATESRFGYGRGTYLSGHTALQQLHADLLAAKGSGNEEFQKLNPTKGDPFRGLGDELGHLALLSRRRQSASRFLSQTAPLFNADVRRHLSEASDHYATSASEVLQAFRIRYGTDKECARIEQIVNNGTWGDDNPEWVAYWKRADEALGNPAKRQAMARHVALALEAERAAVAAIEQALAAEGVETPSAKPVERITTMTTKPDLEKLKLEGGHDKNWFAFTVQSAARLLGKRPDYDTTFALSTNAFAPVIDPGEDCTAWWHRYAQDTCMDLVAGRLGLRAERLALPPNDLTPGDPPDVFARKAAKHREACAPILREAMSRGQLLLIDGGWNIHTDHGFVPWCWWGVVTKAEEDGTIQGATLNGRQDNALDYVGGCWAVTADKPNLSPRKADLAMLERAVARIRGQGERFQSGEHRVFGLDAMDVWIAKMETTPFCEPCYRSAPDRVWTCALSNGRVMIAGAQTVSSYLRKRKDTFAAKARPHVEAAAERYDRIAALLTPAVTGQGGAQYKDFIGDLEKQKAHAKVLLEVKTELAAAADDMEKALAAEGIEVATAESKESRRKESPVTAEVTREQDSARIPDVPVWTVKETPNSVMAAHSMAMKIMGEDVGYSYLMGASGSAFRLQLHEAWCPSSPHSFCGFETVRGAMAALPYQVVAHEVKKDDQDGVRRTRQAVVESIDKGWPCVYGSEEDGLILGYRKGGREWLCNHPYKPVAHKPEAYFVEKDWPWGVGVYTEKKVPAPDRRKCEVESLRLAVELANTKKSGDYLCGFNAWETWIKRLRDEALLREADEKTAHTTMLGNAWIYESLVDARRCAADYCREIAGESSRNAAEHLRSAAREYEHVVTALTQGADHASHIAPYPWMKDHPWTQAKRTDQAGRLSKALVHERRAVAEIEKALAAEGVEAPAPRAPAAPLPKAASLKNVPGGKPNWNAFAGGLTIALNYTGVQTDYDTVMGDLGLAFICQASDQAPRYEGALDAGWWPLAWDCLPTLLQRVSPTFGVQFNCLGGDYQQYKGDPAQYYRDNLENAVKASIASDRPALENHAFWEVVVGYDEEDLPLMSFCPSGEQDIGRLEKHPIAVVTLGATVPRLSRREADIDALQRAVALSRDAIPMPDRYRTGGRAMALWTACLRDTEHLGEARWHGNMCLHLGINRKSAVAYLRAMAKRHPANVAGHLNRAADRYAQVIEELKKADTSKDAMTSKDGREKLAKLVERIAAIEAGAVAELGKALAAAAARAGTGA